MTQEEAPPSDRSPSDVSSAAASTTRCQLYRAVHDKPIRLSLR